MSGSGYPGIFPGGLSTGDTNVGAVGKARSGSAGYPGVFPGGLSTGGVNIGAVQKSSVINVTLLPSFYTDTETFYSAKIIVTIKPSLYTDGETFYSPTVSDGATDVTLLPSLFTDGETFYGATVVLGSITLTAADIDLIWDEDMGDGYSARELMRLFAAVLGGKVSGAGTNTEIFRSIDDDKNVVVATVDSGGNRTAITLDLT